MSFEYWWLLAIPLFFMLGWFAARLDARDRAAERRAAPDFFFRGLNYLLNEQPDRAIDAFIQVAQLDTETIELHFALGSLFRRRGETERAIRVHQSLLQRADLPVSQREQAQFALAQDFLRAGMLDRAEASLKAMEGTRYQTEARTDLLRLYEIEGDWRRALEVGQHLTPQTLPNHDSRVAHFYCESAQQAFQGHPPDLAAAGVNLEAALKVAPTHVRSRLLQIELLHLRGNDDGALAALDQLLIDACDYIGLFSPVLIALHERSASLPQLEAALMQRFAAQPSSDLFEALCRVKHRLGGMQAVRDYGFAALAAHPSLLGLETVLSLTLDAAALGEEAERWALVHTLVKRHSHRLSRYICRACGFKAQQFYWQCPGCNAWDTYLPKRLEDIVT